jgi:pimeloyl-ACP methyl ester carboxylesterase
MKRTTSPLTLLTTTAVATGGTLAALAGINRWISTTVGPLDDQVAGERHLFDWREHQVAYYTAGPPDGPPLLLLHGHNAAASAWEMREPFRRLGATHHVYAPDLLGYGCSDRPPADYAAPLYIDLIRDFLREVVRQPSAVIASSVSAAHAIQVAADDPEWITRLVLIAPVGLNPERTRNPAGPAVTALFRSPVLGEGLFNALVSRASLRYFLADQAYYHKDRVTDDLVEINYQTAHQPGARYAPAAFVGGGLYHDVQDAWPRVGQPVLLAWGDQATFTPASDAAPFLALNPGAELEVFQGCGIIPHDEQPEAFATVVGNWLRNED